MGKIAQPIFCDECSALALVMIEDRVLCAVCLMKILLDSPEPTELKILPLPEDLTTGVD